MTLRRVKYLYVDDQTHELVITFESAGSEAAPILNAGSLSCPVQEVDNPLPTPSSAWLGRIVRYREEDGESRVVACLQDQNNKYQWERLT